MTEVALSASRHELVRERDFLLRSIEDLEREHAAGDVDDLDYAQLRAAYVGRAADVLRALEATGQDDVVDAAPRRGRFRHWLGRRRVRRLLVVVGLICVLGIAGIAAASIAGLRLPGETPTGTVSLPKATQVRDDLADAAILVSSGEDAAAVEVYGQALALDPDQPDALADRGWLVRLAGQADHDAKVVANGDAAIARAVTLDPADASVRALEAMVLSGEPYELTAAVAEVRSFAADHPSKTLVSAYGATLAAIDVRAGAPLPSVLAPYGKR